MFNFEGPQNDLRPRYAQPSLPMDNMPYKHGMSDAELEERAQLEREQEAKKKAAADKRRATRAANGKKSPSARSRSTATIRSKTAKASTTRPPKPLPKLGAKEKPRDAHGRWVKVGAVLWGATKATGRAVKSTAKTVSKAHKAVKCVGAVGRRRRNLELREREIGDFCITPRLQSGNELRGSNLGRRRWRRRRGRGNKAF